VRCVLHFAGGPRSLYEERITLWRAADFEQAIDLAEADARDYAGAIVGDYIGLAQAYQLADEPGHGMEVYSLMRDSDLGPEAYVNRFFDAGDERQGAIDPI
jgi:hypothetical protein